MRMSALFGTKNFGFFEIFVVSARTGERRLSQNGHFADRGGEVNFARMSFINGPLVECLIGTFRPFWEKGEWRNTMETHQTEYTRSGPEVEQNASIE